jgi:hypothetical protein
MHGLSKSRLTGFLQCPRRLWLETHRRDLLPPVDPATQALFDTGHAVGEIARRLYDPAGTGTLIDGSAGMAAALAATRDAVARGPAGPLFEATVERDGLLIRADVIEPANGARGARLVEVKSSTGLKPEHVTDCAIQAWVLEASPLKPASVVLARIDNTFVYAGDGDYRGLLAEEDLTARVAPLTAEVPRWVAAAKATLAGPEPDVTIGSRCRSPYACPFIDHCWPQVEHPLTSLPRLGRRVDALVASGYRDVRDLPETALYSADARRVWRAALSGQPEFTPPAPAQRPPTVFPRCYLDFETVAPGIPLWPGSRPFQTVPFQWSLHVETAPGEFGHREFLDLSGNHPARGVAEALVAAAGTGGPVFTYSRYERQCLDTLAACCPDLADPLRAIAARLFDLLPVMQACWYHPAMQGSWSIKAVLPTVAPDLDYGQLEGVQEGIRAAAAWFRAIDPATTPAEREVLRVQLLRYCAFDTLAMVRVVEFLERFMVAPEGAPTTSAG